MKILIDTNIIIDNALEREPFWNASEQVLSLIEKGTIAGYISASTLPWYLRIYSIVKVFLSPGNSNQIGNPFSKKHFRR